MALLKTAVFIASRFQEFADLREHLKRNITDYPVVEFTPIDLNDGSVSHRPPLEKCLGFVRRAEFLILLVGDTYGSLAPGCDKSFTHLEYEEATREGASTRVLVFMIGESYRDGYIRYSEDNPTFAAWQRQLEARHTLGYLDPDLPPEEKAKKIFDQLLAALYEMRFGVLSVDIDSELNAELFDAVSEDSLDDSEVTALEQRDAELRGIDLAEANEWNGNPLEALLQPAAVAAQEQREEAARAISLRDYGLAVSHLKRAVEFKPLDMKSNYWLAQLYIALGRKDKLAEAEELADRAARVASYDDLKVRAAAAYMLAAQAALKADRREEGLRHARQAVNEAPWFARAHIELARQQVASGQTDEAIESIRTAHRLHALSLKEVYGDLAFRGIRGRINNLVSEIKSRLHSDVEKLRVVTRDIACLQGDHISHPSLDGKSLPKLMEEGRRQVKDQHRRVSLALSAMVAAQQELAETSELQLPISKEVFRFKKDPDAIVIESWHKEAGDQIDHGDVVFTFRFHNSYRSHSFIWRRGPVRLYRLAVRNGAQVTTEEPGLFEHLPLDTQIPEKSKGQVLREQLKEANEEAEYFAKKRAGCQRNIEALGTFSGRFQVVPGIILVVMGLYLLSLGSVLSVIGVFSVPFFHKASKRRTLRAATLKALDHFVAQEYEAQVKVDNLAAQLQQLEEKVIQTQVTACGVLDLFEKRSLNHRGALVPFKSLSGGSPGSIVRVTREMLKRGVTDHGRRIRIVEPLPGLEETLAQESGRGCHLFRVQQMDEHEVVLSRYGAYRRADPLP